MTKHGWQAMLLTLPLVLGCDGLLGPSLDSDVSVRIYAPAGAAWVDDLTIHLRSSGWYRTVHGSSLPDGPFGIPGGDPLTVEVLIQQGADTLAVGYRELDTHADYQYGLGIHGGVGNPADDPWVICIPEVHAIPVRTAIPGIPEDAIYVTWSGIPKDAVC